MTQNNNQNPAQGQDKTANKRPNEKGSIIVQGFVKIFDPKTKEIFVEKRA